MQFTGLWTFPDLTKALGDDYGCVPWPAMPGGGQEVGRRRRLWLLRLGEVGECRCRQGVRQVAVGRPDRQQLDGHGHTASTSRPAPRWSCRPRPCSPVRPRMAAAAQEFGHAQSTILWTPKCSTAFGDMMTKVVKDGADAKAEIAAWVKAIADAEVKRVLG